MPIPDFKKNTDEELLIRHPETNTWVPAVANLNVTGGFVVSMVDAQEQLFTDILTEVQKLDTMIASLENIDVDATSLFNKLQDVESLILSAQTDIATIKTELTTAIKPDVTSIDDHAQSIDVTTTNLKSQVDTIASYLWDGSNSTISRLQDLYSSVDTLETKIQGILDGLVSGGDTVFLKLFENTGYVQEVRDNLQDGLGNTAITRITELVDKLEQVRVALDDETDTALTVLQELKDYETWETPIELTGAIPIINGVNATTESDPVTISAEIEKVTLQSYFSDPTAVLTVLIEMRKGIGGLFNYERKFKQYEILASSYAINTNIYPAQTWIDLETLGCGELVVHMVSVSAGTVTIYGQGYKRFSG